MIEKPEIETSTETDILTFDRKTAAQKLGIGIATLDRQLYKGKLPHVRIGNRVLFTPENLREYLNRQTQNSTQNQN